MKIDINLINEFLKQMEDNENSESECSYCNDPSPSRNCCYYDPRYKGWVEQRLIDDFSKSGNLNDLFKNAYIDIRSVSACPKCGRPFDDEQK